ncbi:hypothetical protein ACFVAE_03540 [Microbacterium sp. NPDC057659]|uniref:hypothetical protein n=1 Tax=Microbacterium sp. NPDC057659 TaxID=3346198 RepID=UPI00367015F7
MNRSHRRLRSAGVAVAATTVIGLLAVPAAYATDTAPDAPRLTPEALSSLSDQYTPRSDGTPGLVAEASGQAETADATPELKSSGPSKSDQDVKGFESKGSFETMQGVASPIALNGTEDWVSVSNAGGLARYDGKGNLKWQIGIHDLSADWQISYDLPYVIEDLKPSMFQGFSPYQPSSVGRHPFAQLDVNGDGVSDVAVAYQLGTDPQIAFQTPGSDLTSGTFVSVIDGATGDMVWHELIPGSVGSMLAQDGKLVVAQNTGPNWNLNPVATQGDSRSSLIAYSFSGRGDKITGTTAWAYSTKAPFAKWSDIESLGHGRITAAWTDTPLGLGNPRPAAGHVLVVDTKDGNAVMDVKTPGYPRIVQKDAVDGRVLVTEQNDPFDAVRLDLTAIDIASGKRTVIASHDGKVPVATAVNPNGSGPRYVLAEIGINADLTDGASTLSGVSANGADQWTYTTESTVGSARAPITGLTVGANGLAVATVSDGVAQSLTQPNGPEHTQLVGVDTRTGKLAWSRDGAVAGTEATPYQGGYLTAGYDLTAWHTDKKGVASAMPLMGDLYAAADYDVNGDGRKDVIAAGQSRGVFALDGAALADGRTKVLWSAAVSSGSHGLHVASVADAKGKKADRVVVATSHGFAVLNPRTGKVQSDVKTGAFQWDVTVADGKILASSDKTFGAYDADGGAVWSYRPASAGDKPVAYSTSVVEDGRVFLEYGGVRSRIGIGTSDPAPTAAAIDLKKGTELWAVAASGAKATWIESQNGVRTADVPGADGNAVAFAFGGDTVTTRGHTVLLLDGRTGEKVKTLEANGSATFQGFSGSKTQGLFWLHTAQIHQLPANGSDPYYMRTIPNVWQAVMATAQDGTELFVGGTGGVLSWAAPFPNAPETYVSALGSAFAYFAGTVTTADLNEGPATDLIALPRDYMAFNLNQSVGGYGDNPFALDNFAHGLTILQASGAKPATGADAAASAPSADAVEAVKATELDTSPLPVGVATAPHQIVKQTAVTPHAEITVPGYTPQQIQKRLGLSGDGEGQTVAITIAYHYPTAKDDANTAAAQFGLPQTCDVAATGEDCFEFEQIAADGKTPTVNAQWNQEAALDIQSIHAVAPKAKIVLVEATDATAAPMYRAVDKAASLKPTAISNSWGTNEFSEEAFYNKHCALTASVCLQSTGDFGWPSSYGSTNPNIIAVGGTNMKLDAEGNTLSETAWKATGGSVSFFQERPAYQDGVVEGGLRSTPDVSFVADPATGFSVFYTANGRQFWAAVGGTSLSAPLWAGILAVTDQLRSADGKDRLVAVGADGASPAHEALYSLDKGLADVTSGSNGLCGVECTAGPGYDSVTGLGSPVAGIDKALAEK